MPDLQWMYPEQNPQQQLDNQFKSKQHTYYIIQRRTVVPK